MQKFVFLSCFEELNRRNIDQSATNLIVIGKSISKSLALGCNSLRNLEFKQVTVSTGKAIPKEVLNKGVDFLFNCATYKLKFHISKKNTEWSRN